MHIRNLGYVTLSVCKIVNQVSQVPIRIPQQYQQAFNMSSLPPSSVADDAPIEKAITQALTENLSPVHLEVVNESYMHNVPKGSETHFKVLVVSSRFESLPLIKRHRLVNDIVRDKLAGQFVHALSIEAKSPAQWNISYKIEPSPNCRGGFGK